MERTSTGSPPRSSSSIKPCRKGKGSKGATRAGNALRMAATVARNSRTAIGAYYRRLAARKGSDVAVFATARKLASLIYNDRTTDASDSAIMGSQMSLFGAQAESRVDW